MPMLRLFSTVMLAFVALTTVAASDVTLTPDDQKCFFTTTPVEPDTPLRSCRTCLNADLATPTCFLDSRGLCLAMSSYDPLRTDGVRQFIAANNTYCPATDAVCNACIVNPNTGNVCTGADGECLCILACELDAWAANVKEYVGLTGSSAGSSTQGPTGTASDPETAVETTTETKAHKLNAASVCAIVFAVLIAVLLIAYAVRRRWRKKQTPSAYNLMMSPSAELKAQMQMRV